MWLVDLMTSFSGRISRREFWIGLALLMVLTVGGTVLLDPGLFDLEAPERPPATAAAVFALAMFIPAIAITVKRLNDRDWPAWLGYALCAVFIPWYIGPFFGQFWDFAAMATTRPGVDSMAGIEALHFWISMPVALFLLIDNGFIRGSRGVNRRGPDPLLK